MKRYTYCRWY